MKPTNKEIDILKKLASRKMEIANSSRNENNKKLLFSLNSLKNERPVILVFPEGSWKEIIPDSSLECVDEKLRSWEKNLKAAIFTSDYIKDDSAIEPFFSIPWSIETGDYGVNIEYTHGGEGGSYVWNAPIKDFDKDFKKLKFRSLSVNKDKTYKEIEMANEIFKGIIPVRLHGEYWWSVGLTWEAIRLIGLENLMLYMYDQPENLHRLMAWLRDETINYLEWFEKEGLLSVLNRDDYVGSGGLGYTNELPGKDFKQGDKVKLKNIWGLSESQETVGVSPEMFNEFVLKYQIPIASKFGLICYGCCEGLHLRIDYILKAIPNLKRVSVSPWADQKIMAEKLQNKYVFSRKPNPAQIAVQFNEENIRKDIKETLKYAGKLSLEIILKDLHTVQNDIKRISRWVEIVREEIDKFIK